MSEKISTTNEITFASLKLAEPIMRAIADDRLDVTRTFGEEMYFCLGCLACMTACPAGVNYAELFEQQFAKVLELDAAQRPRNA